MSKNNVWEDKFSDNFKPNLLEKIIKKLEVPRSQVMISFLPPRIGIFLDLACGSGETIKKISGRFKKAIGMDIAANRIAAAKKLGIENTEFIKHDIDKGIPLKDSSVDYVFCEASLSYFYDIDFVFSEVRRVLKKGGKFILEVPNYAFITRRISLLLGKLPKTSSFSGLGDGGALHYFTYRSLIEHLGSSGFAVTNQTNSGVLPEIRKIFPELLAGDIILVCKKQK